MRTDTQDREATRPTSTPAEAPGGCERRRAAVPPPPTLEQVAERMRGPTFLDALSPEERAERVPDAMETSGPPGPKRHWP